MEHMEIDVEKVWSARNRAVIAVWDGLIGYSIFLGDLGAVCIPKIGVYLYCQREISRYSQEKISSLSRMGSNCINHHPYRI